MLNTPFSGWPSYSQAEIEAVAEVLASNRVNYWTGDTTRRFEKAFAEWTGAAHAVAVTNGTLALDLALRALALGPGDEVVVTPRSFMASASSVALVGAVPVFADVDRDSQNLTAETVEAVLTPRTRAILCVHLAGMPCNMDPLMALAEGHGLKVIEDCAQAHGARYKGRSVGTIGHIGAWSFCQDKIMTTGGEGGMVTTNDPELWARMWSFKDHGKSWEAVYDRKHPPGFRWVHESFGSNYRMLEMQAAIGLVQLDRMGEWTRRRMEIAEALSQTCARRAGLRVPRVPPDVVHGWYRFYAFVRPERLKAGWDRDRIVSTIVERGVPCYQGSCSEIYLEKAFDGTGWKPQERLPVARELGETSLCFLVHPTLTDAEVAKSCEVIEEVMDEAEE